MPSIAKTPDSVKLPTSRTSLQQVISSDLVYKRTRTIQYFEKLPGGGGVSAKPGKFKPKKG